MERGNAGKTGALPPGAAEAEPKSVWRAAGKRAISQRKMGKPQETAGRKAMGAKARRRYAGPAANYEKQTGGNPGAQSYGD